MKSSARKLIKRRFRGREKMKDFQVVSKFSFALTSPNNSVENHLVRLGGTHLSEASIGEKDRPYVKSKSTFVNIPPWVFLVSALPLPSCPCYLPYFNIFTDKFYLLHFFFYAFSDS